MGANASTPMRDLTTEVSKHIDALAVIPSRRTGVGLDLLDIVVIAPHREEGDRLVTLPGTNLGELVTAEERAVLKKHTLELERSKVPRIFSVASSTSGNASFIGQVAPATGGGGVKAERSNALNYALVGEAGKTIIGQVPAYVEPLVRNNLKQLLSKYLALQVREKFIFGVVTKSVTGKIEYVGESVVRGGLHMQGGIDSVSAAVTGNVQRSNRVGENAEGVIGVSLLCFVVECFPDKDKFRMSGAISVTRSNDRYLQAARVYVLGGRRNANMIMMWRRKKNIFVGVHYLGVKDPKLDETTRQELNDVLQTGGRRSTNLSATESNVACAKDGEYLKANYNDFAALWNKNAAAERVTAEDDLKYTLAVRDIADLEEAAADDCLRWFPEEDLPPEVCGLLSNQTNR